jgi:hypothetical protein
MQRSYQEEKIAHRDGFVSHQDEKITDQNSLISHQDKKKVYQGYINYISEYLKNISC